jgi:hypothetical protein
MLPILCVFLAGDFVKQLTPNDLKPAAKPAPVMTCAIPLKEIKAVNPNRMDPMTLPNHGRNMDKGMVRPAPVPVCPRH